MHNYRLANLTINSQFEINYLVTQDLDLTDSNLKLKFKTISKPETLKPYYSWLNEDLTPRLNFYHVENSYYLEYPELIVFEISGKTIFCEQRVLEDYHYLHLLTDQVIPLFLSLKNLVLHASAYSYQDFNIILIGKSGSGKSTLVKMLYPLGKFICDDYLIINQSEEKVKILSSYPGIRLLNQSGSKDVFPIPLTSFQQYANSNQNIFVCLNRTDSISNGKYQILNPKTEEIYQRILTELIKLSPHDSIQQLNLFLELNKLISISKVIQLNYSNLVDVNLNLLNSDLLTFAEQN